MSNWLCTTLALQKTSLNSKEIFTYGLEKSHCFWQKKMIIEKKNLRVKTIFLKDK